MFHSGNLLRNLRQHDYLHVLRKTTAILAIRPRYPSRIESGSKRRIRKDGKGYPVFQFVPFFTIIGTLVFSAAASLLLTSWNIYDCMAVGSGFAYYSLSSLLIVQLKEASAGIEIASQLGAIALLANIIREMLALFGAPLYASFFGKFAPVSVAGINSMDVCLPVISRYSGKSIVPVAIIHGIILEISVPLLISLFCK